MAMIINPNERRSDFTRLEWHMLSVHHRANIILAEPEFIAFLEQRSPRDWRRFADRPEDRPERILCLACHVDQLDMLDRSFAAERAFLALETAYDRFRGAL